MNNKLIVHVSEVNITTETGMGRVEYYWKTGFEKAGYTFIHIGPNEVGNIFHKSMFPYKAYQYFKKLNVTPRAFIIHEPAAGVFAKKKIPCFVESHGIERKSWEENLSRKVPAPLPSIKTRLFYPLWRLYNCDKGLKKAEKLLLINSGDKVYTKEKYKRQETDIFVFKNGFNNQTEITNIISNFTVLFNGSWIQRKGIETLIQAATILSNKGLKINYLLIGTSSDQDTVLNNWPQQLRSFIKVIPKFNQEEEALYLSQSSVFVLPSYAEGQPLSLLQAMKAGKCCITTNCCGQKDIIHHEETGFLFEIGDFEALASQIYYCYNNPALTIEIGKKASLSIENRTWENVANEVVQFVTNNS